jgi:hypothetical protein
MGRVVVLLDVDGVLNPFAARPVGETVWVTTDDGRRVRATIPARMWALTSQLLEIGEVWWATSWEEMANKHIAPLAHLPELPVLKLAPARDAMDGDSSRKMRAIVDCANAEPETLFLWLDDTLYAYERKPPDAPEYPPNLRPVWVEPVAGLQQGHIDLARRFAEGWGG